MLRDFINAFAIVVTFNGLLNYAHANERSIYNITFNEHVWKLTSHASGYAIMFQTQLIYEINKKIISQDLDEKNILLEKNDNDKIILTLTYPNNTYSMIFSGNHSGATITSACQEIYLNTMADDEVKPSLTLCTKPDVLKKISFETVSNRDLFCEKNMTLDNVKFVHISANKSFLYHMPDKKKKKKPYLIVGDMVEVVEYRNGWLRINYKQGKISTFAWIKFTDIL